MNSIAHVLSIGLEIIGATLLFFGIVNMFGYPMIGLVQMLIGGLLISASLLSPRHRNG